MNDEWQKLQVYIQLWIPGWDTNPSVNPTDDSGWGLHYLWIKNIYNMVVRGVKSQINLGFKTRTI